MPEGIDRSGLGEALVVVLTALFTGAATLWAGYRTRARPTDLKTEEDY